MTNFFERNGARNLSYFAMILSLDFLKTFNSFRISVLLLFQEFKKNFQKKLKLSQVLSCLTQPDIISKKAIFYGFLRNGIKKM